MVTIDEAWVVRLRVRVRAVECESSVMVARVFAIGDEGWPLCGIRGSTRSNGLRGDLTWRRATWDEQTGRKLDGAESARGAVAGTTKQCRGGCGEGWRSGKRWGVAGGVDDGRARWVRKNYEP